MHVLTKGLAVAWVGILGIIGAHYAGVAAASGLSAALLNYSGGVISPVSVLGGITLVWLVADWQMASTRKGRENKAILRDKPGLAKDPKGLRRERRIRDKERKLQKLEVKTLHAENRAEKRLSKDGRREDTLKRRRENIAVKKEQLHERQNLGR
jgi:hypothetical protein